VTTLVRAGDAETMATVREAGRRIGEVLAGAVPGRTTTDEITVYKSTGHAVEDAVAARLVYDRAVAAGAGVTVTL
jgi:ornithine cyclodeaminase/alanine dehydrogenase-like protein (mu-crystallin family)